MTCIVGLVSGADVWIGADSLGVGSCGTYPRHEDVAKLFRREGMLLAFSGEPRVGQIIEHVMTVPEHPDGQSVMAYLVSRLVPAMREALIASGWDVAFDPKSETSWSIILGYRSGLYQISYDFQVERLARDYLAAGCGREWAHGSLHTTSLVPIVGVIDPRMRLNLALQAASEHDIHVAPPFRIEML